MQHDYLDVQPAGDVTVVRLVPNRFDESNAHAIGRQLTEVASQASGQGLQVDLRDVWYVSSEGLGQVISLHKKVRASGGHLRLVNAQPLVYGLFAATQLIRVLDVQQKEREAVAKA